MDDPIWIKSVSIFVALGGPLAFVLWPLEAVSAETRIFPFAMATAVMGEILAAWSLWRPGRVTLGGAMLVGIGGIGMGSAVAAVVAAATVALVGGLARGRVGPLGRRRR